MFIDPSKPRATRLELRGMAQLAAPIVAPMAEAASLDESRPPTMDDAEWGRLQAAAEKEHQRAREQDEQGRAEAMEAFAFEVNRRLERAYEAGAQQAVSRQAQRAIAVRAMFC